MKIDKFEVINESPAHKLCNLDLSDHQIQTLLP
jgi:hypothetical protein